MAKNQGGILKATIKATSDSLKPKATDIGSQDKPSSAMEKGMMAAYGTPRGQYENGRNIVKKPKPR